MSSSITRSASFTLTDARYVGAKVGGDLRLLHNLYGRPELDSIPDYAEEVALLLRDGYLAMVDFGFRQTNDNAWKLRLRYTATAGGHLVDNRPGSFPMAAALAGLGFYSYLQYSQKFENLPSLERDGVKASLPIKRMGAEEPTTHSGLFTAGHGYSRHGVGVARDVYVATDVR